MGMAETKIVVSEVIFGNQPIQKIEERVIELLIQSRHTIIAPNFKPAIHPLTNPVNGDE